MKKFLLFFLLSSVSENYCYAMLQEESPSKTSLQSPSQSEKFVFYGGIQGNDVFQRRSKEAIEYVSEETNKYVNHVRNVKDIELYRRNFDREREYYNRCSMGFNRCTFEEDINFRVESYEKRIPEILKDREQSFFYSLMSNLGKKRKKIAREANVDDAERFGKHRGTEVVSFTTMEDGNYRVWREQTANFLKKELSEIINTDTINTTRVRDEECSYEISMFKGIPMTDATEFTWELTKWRLALLQNNSDKEYMSIRLTMYMDLHRTSEHSAEIETTKIYALMPYDNNSPNGLTLTSLDILIADSKKEIGQRQTLLVTQHTFAKNILALERHAISFLPQVIEWRPEQDYNKLHSAVGNVAFPILHSMSDSRGSASQAEWLITGFCLYHGYAIDGLKGFDQWALREPLRNNFIKEFIEKTSLRKL